MPDLIVVSGPPGAGKSTVAQLLVDRFEPSACVPGDDFFGFLRRGRIAPWLPESQAQNEVVLQAAAAAAGRLAELMTVIYDGVVGPWFLPTLHAAAGPARLHYALLLPPLDECLLRVRTRLGHGFTDLDAARHMYREFADAAVDPRHVLVADGDAAAAAAEIERRLVAGALSV